MKKIGIMHKLHDSKIVRILLAPLFLTRIYISVIGFSKTEDAEYIRSYKNKYKGKRCFIIGNGPSLRADDLDMFKGEISFACNRIYNIYEKTAWRPDFWMCIDKECIEDEKENIKRLHGSVKFIRNIDFKKYFKEQKDIHTFAYKSKFVIDKSKFWKEDISTECDKYFSMANTVTATEIEFAIYMGFSEIYLLGVDHNYPISIDKNGKKIIDKSIKSHFNNGGSKEASLHYIYLDAATQCYQVYKNYADAHGIKIYNATRGGKLEVFERILLEDVFLQKDMGNGFKF